MEHIVREAIEIELHLDNMNREEEFLPEQAIEAFLAILKEQNKAFF
jgi:hypothetical protein